MVSVAVLGLGAMGSRVARRLLDTGFEVSVWTRSSGPSPAGARRAVDPADAARGADVVLVCVRDDEASDAVWSALRPGLADAAVAVELSTVTAGRAAALADELGDRFLAAPMVGSRPQIEAGQLQLLVGGAPATLERARPVLEAVAGGVHHVGDSRAAATLKLVVNGLLAVQLAAAGELLAVARAGGVEPAAAAALLTGLPVASPALARSLPRAVGGDLAPAFPLDLVAKDLGYLLEAADSHVPVLTGARVRVDALVAAGAGGDDVVALAVPAA